ncbi:hypothetical protein TNCV_4307001 [Trichonephila clavipes]|nr:hypothetical protein TNCV_4307001 [Trichonephila clavipes]
MGIKGIHGYKVLPWPCQITTTLSNRAKLWRAWKTTAFLNAGELTVQLQKLWHDLPQEVIDNLVDLMSRVFWLVWLP